MLKVSGLNVRYKRSKKWILNDISFELNEGDLVIFAGPSGCGKTTLARALIGLIPHYYESEIDGIIDIFGANPIEEGPISLAGLVGFVSQDPESYITALTVEEELAFPLENLKVNTITIKERINKVLELLKIQDLRRKPTSELSAGQLQKVSIASALSLDPKVLILDEPFARLDRTSARNLCNILEKLKSSKKIIIIFEHRLDDIISIADRIYVMEKGQIIAEGHPKKIVKYLIDIDIPELVEVFWELYQEGKIPELPLSVNEAIEVLRVAK
ncbi:MAG: energy-coupling factor ABC transporter ATP-binding protein [Candidatus Njordarchaeia archaeon]|nr:ABC transporter ATP-binding protein [Candidatus Korarchaeota archaeon]